MSPFVNYRVADRGLYRGLECGELVVMVGIVRGGGKASPRKGRFDTLDS